MRNVTPDMIAEFASGAVRPILMAELYFDSATLRMFTGIGTLEWEGEDYIGGGNFISISNIAETQDTKANGIVVGLNGIPSDLIAAALGEKSRGRPFRLYLASISTTIADDSGAEPVDNQIVDSPYRIFSGLMDVMEFKDDGQTADISLSVENVLIVGQRPKVRRYTNEDQKRYFPSDLGLEFINQLQDKSIVW